jgi:hypothetical protein
MLAVGKEASSRNCPSASGSIYSQPETKLGSGLFSCTAPSRTLEAGCTLSVTAFTPDLKSSGYSGIELPIMNRS